MQFKLIKFIFFSVCFLGGIFLLPSLSLAADVNVGLEYAADLGLSATDPRIVVANAIRIVLGFLGMIALLIILYAGFVMMTSDGYEEKITKAKEILTSAIIGLIIILSAFGLVSFLMSAFLGASGSPASSGPRAQSPGGFGGGSGVIGTGIINSVYPVPFQENVPKNTAIMITFNEEMDVATIISNGRITSNIKIFKKEDVCDENDFCIVENVAADAFVNAVAQTRDNKTFVFKPDVYLDKTDYLVYLDNGLSKKNGEAAFSGIDTTSRSWEFGVSDILDLEPPRVISIFPPPDDAADAGLVPVTGAEQATRATGRIVVNDNPDTATVASAIIDGGNAFNAKVEGEYACDEDGVIGVSLQGAVNLEVVIGGNNVPSGIIKTSGRPFTGRTINIGCGISLLSDVFAAGQSWSIRVTKSRAADSLRVGDLTYVFVSNEGVESRFETIVVGSTLLATAENIKSKLISNNKELNISRSDSTINLEAKAAGEAGNDIDLSSSASGLLITRMSGGSDIQTIYQASGRRDQPRNVIIQISFNEAINPMSISGTSEELKDIIRVKSANGSIVSGEFVVSNVYRTVEFISDNLCGINGCGEQIFCLPGGVGLQVELVAAGLQTCATNADCLTSEQFVNCPSGGGICYKEETIDNQSKLINYPLSDFTAGISGVVDATLNSLDGNKNENAEGPVSFFNENTQDSQGDNFKWSFYTSEMLDLSSPEISEQNVSQNGIIPVKDAGDLNSNPLSEPIRSSFTKVMQSNSLRSGSRTLQLGNEEIVHQMINLSNLSGYPTGYWVSNEALDTIEPLDSYPDITNVFIEHTEFSQNNKFKATIGSGVRDIYQNCFKPCVGPACSIGGVQTCNENNPSCCSGVAGVDVCE